MSLAIVDIDGTLSIVGSRIECLKSDPPDWDAFYARCNEDVENHAVSLLVGALFWDSWRIVLLTGRPECVRQKTGHWLTANHIEYDQLIMRRDGDFRHDTIVKPELLQEAGIPLSDISLVLEDRNSMVKKWRELGLTCLQVAEGDF